MPGISLVSPHLFRHGPAQALTLSALLWFICLPAAAQRYHISYTPNSQEGLLLQLIEQLDGPAKAAQMEAFVQRFPNHPSVNWIHEHLQNHYTKSGDIDKALEAGEQLLLRNPEDIEAALANWKLAEKKNDPRVLQKWKEAVTVAAQKQLGSPRPFYVSQEEWNKKLEYAGGLIAQSEYALYKQVVDGANIAARTKAYDALIAQSPNSVYIVQAWPHMMRAFRSAGNTAKALEVADKILAKDSSNEDAMLVSAQIWLDRRANYDRVIGLATRVLSLFQQRQKPESISQEDWDARRLFFTGAAHQLMGSAYVFENKFPQADRAFRAALPYLKGNTQAESSAMFYIGFSNYYMENYKEAAQWFQQCMALSTAFQQQASKQLETMRRERRIPPDD